MAVELMMGYRNDSFVSKMEENAVQEAASGLESVNKLIRLLSQHNQEKQQQQQQPSSSSSKSSPPTMDIEIDCKAVADVAVSKFKKVISLLGRTRTGHARFRRAPVLINQNQNQESHHQSQVLESSKVYYATPIQQIPPPALPNHHHHLHDHYKNNGVVIERKDSSTTINFSYSSAPGNSFISSLTGETDGKQQQQQLQPSSSSPFQITNLSQVSNSAGKPPLSSSSFKRKCSSETLGSAKCSGGSSGRCHCSKKR